jgi:excisionase family DNA binding protein
MTGLVLRPSPVRQDLKLMQPRCGGALFVRTQKHDITVDKPPASCVAGTRKQADMETEWLTANEAAQYLKVRPRTLLQWVRENKIPAHRLSGVRRCVWRFRKHELDAILCSSSADPTEGRQQ